jgi:glycosidase
LRGQLERVQLAFAMLFTLPGAPTVYYGDEIGMAGGHDPDNRRGMIWDESRWHKPIQRTIQQMSALRRSFPVLRRGPYQ